MDSIMFDNATWVLEHEAKIDRNDIDGTFRYVTRSHPYFGCAANPFLVPGFWFTGEETLEQLSLLADAVTVACVEALGKTQTTEIAKVGFDRWDWTSVGNWAYIALHHSDQKVRERVAASVNKWKECTKRSCGAVL